MRTVNFKETDGFAVITSIVSATVDPAQTAIKVKELIANSPELVSNKTEEELFNENAVFFRPLPNQINVDDAEAGKLQKALSNLKDNEKLLTSGKTIVDFRDSEYYLKQSDKWEKAKIEKLGENLPSGAIRSENLSGQQQKEIAEQTEAERIEKLSPEQKAAEKESTLASVRHEIKTLKEDAEVCGESFDAPAEYQKRKEAIDKKYA